MSEQTQHFDGTTIKKLDDGTEALSSYAEPSEVENTIVAPTPSDQLDAEQGKDREPAEDPNAGKDVGGTASGSTTKESSSTGSTSKSTDSSK